MPARSKPLTKAQLARVDCARAEARERSKTHRDEPDPPKAGRAPTIDPENPPLTDEQLARMRPVHEVHPQLVAARLRRPGRPPAGGTTKKAISLRIDADILERLRATGAGWQSRINDILRKARGGPRMLKRG